MSICYDFQKWTMVTFGLIATSLTVGLVLMQYAHGQVVDLPCTIYKSNTLRIIDLNCNGSSDTITLLLSQGWKVGGISDNAHKVTNYMYLVIE
jgi:hypothetical protein